MNNIYEEVPNIITGKDLDYLSDMFNWTYEAYKVTYNHSNDVTDEEIKNILENASNTFKNNLENILNLLNNGGINEQ